MEIWKIIPSAPDYEVSNLGHVRDRVFGRGIFKKGGTTA